MPVFGSDGSIKLNPEELKNELISIRIAIKKSNISLIKNKIYTFGLDPKSSSKYKKDYKRRIAFLSDMLAEAAVNPYNEAILKTIMNCLRPMEIKKILQESEILNSSYNNSHVDNIRVLLSVFPVKEQKALLDSKKLRNPKSDTVVDSAITKFLREEIEKEAQNKKNLGNLSGGSFLPNWRSKSQQTIINAPTIRAIESGGRSGQRTPTGAMGGHKEL